MIIISCFLLMTNDFDIARMHYEKGNFQIARTFFEEFIEESANDPLVPEAIYYLIKIYDQAGDVINLLAQANDYLKYHKFNLKRDEIFNLLLNRLVQKQAYLLAFDYIKNYDYLTPDSALLTQLCLELAKNPMAADYILPLCPKNDSIKILYAQGLQDLHSRERVYKSIEDTKGKLYLMENYLLIGDTINAYNEYQKIVKESINDAILYRFTKIARFFEKEDFEKLITRLAQIQEFSSKAKLLAALNNGYLATKIIPTDEEELNLLIQIYGCDSVATAPPENINLDSLSSDTTNIISEIENLRRDYKENYYLDSVYSEISMNQNQIASAYNVMKKYLKYHNVRNYIRKIRAHKYFEEKNFQLALNDIILSGSKEPKMKFLYAQCLKELHENPSHLLYAEVMKSTDDSTLYTQALRRFIETAYANQHYKSIIDYDIEDFLNDTTLIKIYLNSLARLGKKARADSIYVTIFSNFDFDYLNAYGEYLIGKKLLDRAQIYYDSIISTAKAYVPPEISNEIYFNWAIIPFLQGNFDFAEERFKFYIKNFMNTKNYFPALFKIATIKYLQEDFDSAGYYYGLTSPDSLLRLDALRNQVISYKKAEDWQNVIEQGGKILSFCSDEDKPDLFFEIGYAYLRNGNVREAIENLKIASVSKLLPEFYYWLGEAYLGKGDFLRALYQYQKIVQQFSKDEMWRPTAEFKSGLALEFLDEPEEAKKIYKSIIRRRGISDVWGAEAQKRLELLK